MKRYTCLVLKDTWTLISGQLAYTKTTEIRAQRHPVPEGQVSGLSRFIPRQKNRASCHRSELEKDGIEQL